MPTLLRSPRGLPRPFRVSCHRGGRGPAQAGWGRPARRDPLS